MHTETRIGVSVGMRARKCMQSGMHTKRIQNAYKHKKSQKRGFFLLLLLYTACSYIFYCPCLQAIKLFSVRVFGHSSTNHKRFTACYCGQWAFRAFIARLTGHPPSSRPILVPRSSHVPAGVYAFRPFRRLRCLDGRSKTCMHCMHQKTDYALYAKTQLRKRLHTMHTETRIGVSVGMRARKCMQSGMHTKCIQNAYKHIKE